ncbi:MAG: histidine phosphatase family protein [Filomicrobium sp.]
MFRTSNWGVEVKDGVTLYCIRHGQTDWNAQSRYQGQVDIPLNDTGRAQALRNGKALAARLPDIAAADFVSSPLSRACETMRIVRGALDLPADEFTTDERLKEVHYGEWQGQLLETLVANEADGIAARRADPYHYRPPGGESYQDLLNRMCQWLETVERDTVVTTHGGITRTLRAHLLDLDLDKILELEVPQDQVLVIRRGTMSWL